MSRTSKIVVWIAGTVLGLVVLAAVAWFVAVETGAVDNFARKKIISSIEQATGGTAEVASFHFRWRTFTATIQNLVIHGTEPAGSPPLFRAPEIVVKARLLASLRRPLRLEYLGVSDPAVNVISFPDGRTNIPKPRVQPSGNQSGLETVVNLAIGRMQVDRGVLNYLDWSVPFDVQAADVHAQLDYKPAAVRYQGQLSMDVAYRARDTLTARMSVPVVLGSDAIQITGARIATEASVVNLNASLEHVAAPAIRAQVAAHIALDDVAKAGIQIRPQPRLESVEASAMIQASGQATQIENASVQLGQSRISAAGNLNMGARFDAALDLAELAPLVGLEDAPAGVLYAGGSAKVGGNSDYLIIGKLEADDLAYRDVKSARVTAGFRAEPNDVQLRDLTVTALGGVLRAGASLRNSKRFSVDGTLQAFHLETLAAVLTSKHIGYSGTLAGDFHASGEIRGPTDARAQLTIRSGGSGVPVSGAINASYDSTAGLIELGRSYIVLPNSRIDFSGEVGRSADLRAVSRNLSDLQPALALASSSQSPLPVALKGGTGTLVLHERGPLSNADVTGNVNLTKFAVRDRTFDRIAADFRASPSQATIHNGALVHGSSQANFSGSIGLKNWKPAPDSPLTAKAAARDTDIGDLAALAGSGVRASGKLNADVDISGTLANPQGSAQAAAMNGAIGKQPFDRIQLAADFSDQRVDVNSLEITTGSANVQMNASFLHPRDSFENGRIQAHLATNDIHLEDIPAFRDLRPGLAAVANMRGDVVGELRGAAFMPSALNAYFRVTDIHDAHQHYGDITATAATYASDVATRIESNFAGSNIQITSRTQLKTGYPTTGEASIAALQLEQALAIFNPRKIPATGVMSANADFSGTIDDPHANLSVNLTNAAIFDERLNRLDARVDYRKRFIRLGSFKASLPAGNIEMNGSIASPAGILGEGRAELHIATSNLRLERVQHIRTIRPEFSGAVHVEADLSADLARTNGRQEILPRSANIDAGLTGLATKGRSLGGITVKGQTQGDVFSMTLAGKILNSEIRGGGRAQLKGDYPGDAKVSFTNVRYSDFLQVTGSTSPFDALIDGQADFSGALTKPDQARADLHLSRLEFSSTSTAGAPLTIRNQGPIVAGVNRSVIDIQSANFTGPSTNIDISGTAGLKDNGRLDVTFNAMTNLELVKHFYPTAFGGGVVIINSTIRGTAADPEANGRIELKNASFQLEDWPNGISNANGVILLDGHYARIASLNAETGGGKFTAEGSAGFNGATFDFDLRANAKQVRTRYSGASVTADAAVTLTGTSRRSVLGGTVTITRVGYNQQSDIGTILSGASSPPAAPSPDSITGRTRLNIRVQTAPGIRFQTDLAESLSARAELTVLGTLNSPGLVGRVNVTSGSLIFFGNKYDVNRGTVSFYDPTTIRPVLDIDLLTAVQGVSVDLSITGPIDNLKLSYHSDPPLRFEDIIALLATGKTPGDPTIAVNQPNPATQSFTQLGESAVLAQAVANPIANRLERVFGVTQLRITPTFVSGSTLPQARVTLSQQISSNLTFTYSQDLTQANAQLIRIEWLFTPRFSAVATRDENGVLGVDFFYKKQFR